VNASRSVRSAVDAAGPPWMLLQVNPTRQIPIPRLLRRRDRRSREEVMLRP